MAKREAEKAVERRTEMEDKSMLAQQRQQQAISERVHCITTQTLEMEK